LRHGNFDYVSKAVLWDPANADHDLPPSLYRSSKPGWWGGLAWPAIGPDTANVGQVLNGKIPAQVRYEDSTLGIDDDRTFALLRSSLPMDIQMGKTGDQEITFVVYAERGVAYRLTVFDIDGKMVWGKGLLSSSRHQRVVWTHENITSGTYVVMLSQNHRSAARKFLIAK
jgi:hypothetical protein